MDTQSPDNGDNRYGKQESRAIAGRTSWCRFKFRHASKFTTTSCGIPAITWLLAGLCRLQWVICQPGRRCWGQPQFHGWISREIIFQVFQPVWKTYLNFTDRRTTYCGITALCVTSRGNNWINSRTKWCSYTATKTKRLWKSWRHRYDIIGSRDVRSNITIRLPLGTFLWYIGSRLETVRHFRYFPRYHIWPHVKDAVRHPRWLTIRNA